MYINYDRIILKLMDRISVDYRHRNSYDTKHQEKNGDLGILGVSL